MKATDKPILEKISKRVKELRKEKGLTQFSLSIESDVDIRQIQRIEGEEHDIGISTITKIANLGFGMTLSEFFDFESSPILKKK